MITTMRFMLLALVVHMLGEKAGACVILPVFQEPAQRAIDRATDIGLVRVDKIEKVEDGVRIAFTPLEVLKGSEVLLQSTFFRCSRCTVETLDFRVASHESIDFFSGAETSISMMPDCSIVPSVRVGERHLFLNSDPISRFILEKVSEDDRWLEWAREYINRGMFRPVTAQEYLLEAESMRIVSCEEWPNHYICKEGAKFVLKVRERSSARIFYPSTDGQCFTLEDEFERRHGFENGGLDVDGQYCLGDE